MHDIIFISIYSHFLQVLTTAKFTQTSETLPGQSFVSVFNSPGPFPPTNTSNLSSDTV